MNVYNTQITETLSSKLELYIYIYIYGILVY
jgi:hypothetical protein